LKYKDSFKEFENARNLRITGKVTNSIEILKKLVEKHPGFYLAHFNLGLAYDKSNKYKLAELHYKKASQIESDGDLPVRDPSIHNTYGYLLLRQRKYDEAKEEYLATLKLYPGHPKALNGLQCAIEALTE